MSALPSRFPDRSAAAGARPTVCIVTSELVGPFNNGGIGTSMTGLAQTLAAAGYPVTVLYTGGHCEGGAERARWRRRYAGIGIALVWLCDRPAARITGPLGRCGFVVPWQVYEYLSEHQFEVVQFNDCMGEGFLCLAMRRLGAAFADTTMFVALHSPSQWIFEINRTLPDALLHAAFSYAERLSVKCADLLWGPSRYLIAWAHERGFELPDATYVQKYVLPTVPLFDPATAAPSDRPRERVKPREIVFFGRLEERKGLRTFCEALRLLGDALADGGIKVTFLGKEGTVADRPALLYLADEASHWRFEWSVLADYGQQQALAHLMSGAAVAVMASPADNSPCTVYEAMSLGIPFIAARTGGIPELIDERDHSETLFEPEAEALAARIGQALGSGIVPARSAEAPAETERRWIAAFESHRQLSASAPPAPPGRPPSIVAVVDAVAGTDLSLTLSSLAGAGTIVVISRRERPDTAAAPAPVVILEAYEHRRLAACLEEAGAEAVLFLRGGAMLLPGALAALGVLLDCPQADGLVPAAAIGPDVPEAVLGPLGGSQSFCFFEGPMPGGAMFVKAAPLLEVARTWASVPEAEFLGLPDLAIARGLDIWPFAEAVIRHPGGVVSDPFGGRAAGRVQAYCDIGETERYYLSAVAHGQFERPPGPAPAVKALRDRMIAYRLGWVVRLAERRLPRLVRALRRRG